jgi:predicted membrane protein
VERVARAGCVAVVGLVVGALTSFGQTYLDGPSNAFVNSASAWLIAPFFVGASMPTRRGAAAAGIGVCSFQLVGYYLTAHVRGFPASQALVAFWAVCAVVGGPIAGVGGRLWRAERPPLRGLGAAVLASAFLAEGLWVYFHELHYEGTAALWIAIGIGVAAALGRGPRDWAWLAATVPVAVLAEVALSRVYAQSF